jgi:RNA polymerase sigma-70 factor (ECF subfamily)
LFLESGEAEFPPFQKFLRNLSGPARFMLETARFSETGLKDAGHEAEERLLIEAAQRDPARFGELYELYFERVYAFVAKRVRVRAESEDIVSSVFYKALENLNQFEWRGSPMAGWLFRIAANEIADRWRRAAREQGHPAPEAVADAGISPEDTEDCARLFRLIKKLPADQQRVIEMRFAEEKSIREIAQELKRTEGAVKQLQFRAMETLRARVSKESGAAHG